MSVTPSDPRGAVVLTQCRAALTIHKVDRRSFPPGPATQDEIVTTNRLILVLRGNLSYKIDGLSRTMKAGDVFFVPAWVRRMWSASRSSPCEIVWVEFDGDEPLLAQGISYYQPTSGERSSAQKRSFMSLLRLFRSRQTNSPWSALRQEITLKAVLVDFWEAARPAFSRNPVDVAPSPHPQIRQALRWAESNFHNPAALAHMYANSALSPNYFRVLFGQSLKCSPQAYLERLRLRRARHLIQTTNWQIKRIATEVGYDDPLYFSRIYRRFWGHSPSFREATLNRSAITCEGATEKRAHS